MQPSQSTRYRRHGKALRLLLTALLALAPLLSTAQTLLMTDAMAGNASVAQMPCHNDSGNDRHAADAADCPHCAGDAPASQCSCCEQAAPPVLAMPSCAVFHPTPTCAHAPVMISDAVPSSPGERLYRPPIQSS